MENVKSFLSRVRKQDKSTPRHIQILVSIGIAMAGFALGVLQKWLDSGAVNELPVILQKIDIGNYFGRFAIWILLGTVISVYARTPIRAALNTFLFFICMVAGYYDLFENVYNHKVYVGTGKKVAEFIEPTDEVLDTNWSVTIQQCERQTPLKVA